MSRVITYGTFDLLHYGHINLRRRAKEQGDYLMLIISADNDKAVELFEAALAAENQEK